MKNQIFVGYEIGTGDAVFVPVFHTLFTGQTQLSGKTTALKALAKQAAKQGFKVLVIDTKTNFADYLGFGQEVPVCLQYSTDTLVLRNLLESINERKLTIFQGTLTRVTEDATTYEEVIENLRDTEEKARSDFIKDACHMLANLLQRLIDQTKKVETTSDLELPYAINRMAINQFEVQGQQLIIRSIFKEALKKYRKLIIILDESYKFLPQKYTSACQTAIQEYVTQGAITQNFLWESTQFLAPTNKDSMKAMPVKLLGTQDHITECTHTYELMPSPPKGLVISYRNGQALTLQKADTIMNLKVGHFILVTKDSTRAVYIVPDGGVRSDCLDVALGNKEPKDIHLDIPLEEKEELTREKSYLTDESRPPLMPLPKTEPEHPKTETNPEPTVPPVESPPEPSPASTTTPQETATATPEKTPEPESIQTLTLEHPKIIVNLEIPIKHIGTISTEKIRGKVLYMASLGLMNDWKTLKELFEASVHNKIGIEYNTLKQELPKMVACGYLVFRPLKGKQNAYTLAPNIFFNNTQKDVNINE